ncbi:MAG: tetratricopeptide repeat protein, partial [Candidatus Zixiibacteriota bacterium]
NKPRLAVQHLDNILWEDAHYQTDYKDAIRCLSWGYLLYKYENEPDRAIKYFERRLSVLDKDFESAYHLGEIYMQKEILDSAEVYYLKAVQNDSTNIKYLKKLAMVKSTLNKKDESIVLLRRIVQLEPENPKFRNSFAIALSMTNNIDEALVNFKKAYQLDNSLLGALITIGDIYIYLQQYDSAYSYLTMAQKDNPEIVDIYPLLIKTQIALDKFSEALTSWEQYQQLKPTAPELDDLHKIIIEGLNK